TIDMNSNIGFVGKRMAGMKNPIEGKGWLDVSQRRIPRISHCSKGGIHTDVDGMMSGFERKNGSRSDTACEAYKNQQKNVHRASPYDSFPRCTGAEGKLRVFGIQWRTCYEQRYIFYQRICTGERADRRREVGIL